MSLIYKGRSGAVPPHKDGMTGRQANRVYAFWVVLEGDAWGSPLMEFSPEGEEAIAVFSGEEEARIFCHFLGEEGANSTIRQTTAGGVLSLLSGPCSAKHVALDPFPGILGNRLLGLVTIDRARFARRFASVDQDPVLSGQGAGRA